VEGVNKIYVYILLLAIGFAVCFFTMPTKTITVTKEVVKYVQVATQSHQVTTTQGGVTTTVIDTVSHSQSHTTVDSTSKTEINKKKMTILGGYLIGKDERAFQATILTNVTNSVIIGTGMQYNTTNRYAMGLFSIGLQF
jgi:hypothetical protein